jgi:hypothetical protein
MAVVTEDRMLAVAAAIGVRTCRGKLHEYTQIRQRGKLLTSRSLAEPGLALQVAWWRSGVSLGWCA